MTYNEIYNIASFGMNVDASESIPFKAPITTEFNWKISIFALIALFIAVVFFIKKNAQSPTSVGNCKIIESRRLSTKTMLHILQYENQLFILADNQQALCLQQLEPRFHP